MFDLEPIHKKRAAHLGLPPPATRKALRQEAGLSQQDVAEALGVYRETISRWETGKRSPRKSLLIAYVSLLRELRG